MRLIRRVLFARVDLWEALLVAGLVVFAYRAFGAGELKGHVELNEYRRLYGPDHQTEGPEEWLIRDFFQGRRGGFFVDVGANHHQQFSKTWYLEKELGWSGIAIEPLQQFAAGYAEHRPGTKFFPLFVSAKSDEAAQLYVIDSNTSVSSSNREFIEIFGSPDRVETVPTIALDDLLAREGRQQIDFLSMDIELHEPEALKGFDIGRWRPALVCIEGLLTVRQPILDYFTRHGYVLIGKYLRADTENLYFRPLEAEPAATTPDAAAAGPSGAAAVSGRK